MSLFTLTVAPWERALVRRAGEPTRVLAPGRHRRLWSARYETVDLREQLLTTSVQEVPTSDGLSLRLTVAITWRITDPVAHTERVADPVGRIYLAAQLAARDAVAQLDVAAVAGRRAALSEAVMGAVVGAGAEVGVEVTRAVIKDLMLPAEVRASSAQLITSRHQATMALEAARAETAALRSLANAAKLLDDHPALARLRTVQAVPYGSSLTLTFDDDA